MRENYERYRRRNNVIVSGLIIQSNRPEEMKKVVGTFFEEEMYKRPTVVSVRKIKPDVHVVELSSYGEKMDILRDKFELKERGVHVLIYPDRTTAERRKKFEMSKFARVQEALGKEVRFANRGLYVDGEKWVWSEEEDKLVKVTS